jgi:hypothetical protein
VQQHPENNNNFFQKREAFQKKQKMGSSFCAFFTSLAFYHNRHGLGFFKKP